MTRRACDTSVLVPALLSWHHAHAECREVLSTVTAVPAHVLVECYSVLTRLPAPHRVSPADASALVTGLPFAPVALPPADLMDLLARLGERRIRGGAAYDALIAATAQHHGLALVSRDHRARSTYDVVGAEIVDG